MKNLIYLSLLAIIVSSCGVSKQYKQTKAFEKCKYEIRSADSLYLANVNVMETIKSGNFDIIKSPRLVFALLRKNVPLEGNINLEIKNPTPDLAAIRQFEYKLLIKDQEIANGFVDQTISVAPNGGQTIVPIKINSNIYGFLSDSGTQRAILDFFDGNSSNRKSVLTIKIKPTIGFGNKEIKFPGYITINKEITKGILL